MVGYIDLLHKDRFSIKRYKEVENDDGTIDVVLKEDPELTDIKCRISKLKEDEDDTKSIDVNNKNNGFKIFCSPSIKVQKGDYIVANKYINNELVYTVKGYAGKPLVYHINQEIVLKENKPE